MRCDCGGHHWGLYGAAGLLLVRRDTPEPQVLLQLRANWTHGGGTWALPGGALDSHEDSIAAAKREAFEEVGVHEHHLTVVHTYSDDHGPWRYDTVIAHTQSDAGAYAANAESEDLQWVAIDEVENFALHKGLALAWPELRVRVLATLA